LNNHNFFVKKSYEHWKHFSGQYDSDGDTIGDVCDNCPSVSNVAQTDVNENGIGDSCETSDK